MSDLMRDAFDRHWLEQTRGSNEWSTIERLAAKEAFEAAWQAALEHAGRGGVKTWQGKPTTTGRFVVRGFDLADPSREAIVEVAFDEGELVCNLHDSNSDEVHQYSSLLSEISDSFEWSRLYTQPPEPATTINWSDEKPPNDNCPYNHVTADTPFGPFLITWKGWKEHDCPTVDETPWGDWFGAFRNVEEAKAECEKEYAKRLAQAQPPAPVVPDGYATIPLDPRNSKPQITNEMKHEHIGEYRFSVDQSCSACAFHEPDEDCEVCGGEVQYQSTETVPWDLCKQIYQAMAETAMLNATTEPPNDR